jgi:hypothetical protein
MTMNVRTAEARPRSPSPAERMRAYRKRRRRGARSLWIQLDATAIGLLITKGYLEQGLRNDLSAIQFAINSFIDDALRE